MHYPTKFTYVQRIIQDVAIFLTVINSITSLEDTHEEFMISSHGIYWPFEDKGRMFLRKGGIRLFHDRRVMVYKNGIVCYIDTKMSKLSKLKLFSLSGKQFFFGGLGKFITAYREVWKWIIIWAKWVQSTLLKRV